MQKATVFYHDSCLKNRQFFNFFLCKQFQQQSKTLSNSVRNIYKDACKIYLICGTRSTVVLKNDIQRKYDINHFSRKIYTPVLQALYNTSITKFYRT